MRVLAVIPLLLVVGCSTQKIEGFKEPELVSRAEIIQASKDCIHARMRPNIQHLPQKTEHGTIMLPVFVTCEPYKPR